MLILPPVQPFSLIGATQAFPAVKPRYFRLMYRLSAAVPVAITVAASTVGLASCHSMSMYGAAPVTLIGVVMASSPATPMTFSTAQLAPDIVHMTSPTALGVKVKVGRRLPTPRPLMHRPATSCVTTFAVVRVSAWASLMKMMPPATEASIAVSTVKYGRLKLPSPFVAPLESTHSAFLLCRLRIGTPRIETP